MLTAKNIQSRIKMKNDTTENWNSAMSFIPLKGEIIVYNDYDKIEKDGEYINIPNFKVGDGLAYCTDLPFVNDDLRNRLNMHIAETSIHVSSSDREFWNNKVRCYIIEDDDNLIFTTN